MANDFNITVQEAPANNLIVPVDYILSELEICNPKPKELAWINKFQPAVEQTVKKRLGYNPIYACRTDYMPAIYGYRRQDPFVRDFDVRGNRLATEWGGPAEGADQLVMPHTPIRSIQNLWENPSAFGGQSPGDFSNQYLLIQGQDYYIDWQEQGLSKSGVLYRIYMHWPVRPRTVKVEYTTGYTSEELLSGIASPIGLAVVIAMQYFFWAKGRQYLTETSESLGGFSRSFAKATAGALPVESQKLLTSFMNYSRFL